MQLSRLALAVALLPAGYSVAETPSRDEALKLSNTLITANRAVQERSESTSASSVFTRADIERLRPTSVPDLLSHVPGVQVARYGGRGALTSLFIRGTSTAQSMVLIDGVRVSSATSGGASLQYLSVEQIERVEVLRGSRSAIYGSDAIGGVVQIFTRRGAGSGLKPYVRIAGGSDNTWERSLGLSGGDERTHFSLNAASEETNGFDRTQDSYASDADNDAYRNRSFSLNIGHQLTDTLKVGLSTLDQRGKSETDNPYGRWDNNLFTAFPSQPYDQFSLSSTSAYVDAQVMEAWNSRVELGHTEDKQENFDKLFPGSTRNNTFRDSINWLNTFDLEQGHSLRAGAEYLNDKVRSSNAFTEPSRKNYGLFAQHTFQGEQFSTELGVRHDKNEQYGSENTWNGALTLPMDAANDLILSYAEGFRVPTFADLYWTNDGQYKGNPDLQPEKSKSYELQWRSQLGERTTLEASVYRTDLHNLITYVSDPVTRVGTMENVQRARIHGFEANLKQELFGWQGDLGVSIIDPRNRENGHTLTNRAKRTLSLDLDRQFDRFAVGATWQAFSHTYNDTANSQEIAGYGVLNLRASWQVSQELGFDVKWANVLDRDYSGFQYTYNAEQFGYQETPSSVMFGMTWSPEL